MNVAPPAGLEPARHGLEDQRPSLGPRGHVGGLESPGRVELPSGGLQPPYRPVEQARGAGSPPRCGSPESNRDLQAGILTLCLRAAAACGAGGRIRTDTSGLGRPASYRWTTPACSCGAEGQSRTGVAVLPRRCSSPELHRPMVERPGFAPGSLACDTSVFLLDDHPIRAA